MLLVVYVDFCVVINGCNLISFKPQFCSSQVIRWDHPWNDIWCVECWVGH